MPGTEWPITEIAKPFLGYFIDHPEHRFDCKELAESANPESFKLSRVISKLKSMPLKFLSNKATDYFVLDGGNDRFELRDVVHGFWGDERYRGLVRERVGFGNVRYFARR